MFQKVKDFISAHALLVGCLIGVALVCCCQLCGCSDESSSGSDCPKIGGYYKIMSGSETIMDNFGQKVDVDFTVDSPGNLGISQDGCGAVVIGCVWDLRGDGTCNTNMYGIDSMYGPTIGSTTGKLTLNDDKTIGIELDYAMEYPMIGYSVFADIDFCATPDPELLEQLIGDPGEDS